MQSKALLVTIRLPRLKKFILNQIWEYKMSRVVKTDFFDFS